MYAHTHTVVATSHFVMETQFSIVDFLASRCSHTPKWNSVSIIFQVIILTTHVQTDGQMDQRYFQALSLLHNGGQNYISKCLNICAREKIYLFLGCRAGPIKDQNPTWHVESYGAFTQVRWKFQSFFSFLAIFFPPFNFTRVLSCFLTGGWFVRSHNAITISSQSLHFTTFISIWMNLQTWKGTFCKTFDINEPTKLPST